jgi:hypothetical protein
VADVHNALKFKAPWQTGLATLAGVVEDAGVERLGETWTPVLDPTRYPELHFLAGEYLVGFSASQLAGGAGTFAGVYLTNNTSNMLVVIEYFAASDTANAGVLQTSAALTAGLVQAPCNRDTRYWLGTGGLRCPTLWGRVAAVGGSLNQGPTLQFGALDTQYIPHVVHPGYSFLVQHTAENQPLTVSIGARIRTLVPGELKPR